MPGLRVSPGSTGSDALVMAGGADPQLKNNYATSAWDWIVHRREEGEAEATDEALEQLVTQYLS